MTKLLSPTQAQILSAAAQHPARLAEPPAGLPAAARNAVVQSMLRAGLLEETPEPEGGPVTLRITSAGLEAVGAEPSPAATARDASTRPQEGGVEKGSTIAPLNVQEPPVAPAASSQSRARLRGAAADLLVAWDAGEGRPDLTRAVETLRAALCRAGVPRLPRDPSAPRRPPEGTKQQAVLTLLRRTEGTTIAQVMEATGWAQHTVRGFLAGLKKKGHTVEVLERVRQVGPGAQGAKGSYSIYRIAAEEQG